MINDIRLAVGFWHHPKTKRLIREAGLEAVRSLQILWCWAAQYRPDGNISDLDDDDIEDAADWNGARGEFVSAIKDRWLEQRDGDCWIHDWSDHNTWAAEAEDRSNEARLSKLAQVNRPAYEMLVVQGITSITREQYSTYKRLKLATAERPQSEPLATAERPQSEPLATSQRIALAPAPAPAPAPSPSPALRNKKTTTAPDREDPVLCRQLQSDDLSGSNTKENHHDRKRAAQDAETLRMVDNGQPCLNLTTFDWEHIHDTQKEAWREAYPACDIDVELRKAAEWIRANPSRRKRNWTRYLVNWLSRQQDKGGTHHANSRHKDAYYEAFGDAGVNP